MCVFVCVCARQTARVGEVSTFISTGRGEGWGLPVKGVQHLNHNEHRESHRHGVRILEDGAVNSWEHAWFGRALHVVSLTT